MENPWRHLWQPTFHALYTREPGGLVPWTPAPCFLLPHYLGALPALSLLLLVSGSGFGKLGDEGGKSSQSRVQSVSISFCVFFFDPLCQPGLIFWGNPTCGPMLCGLEKECVSLQRTGRTGLGRERRISERGSENLRSFSLCDPEALRPVSGFTASHFWQD